MYKCAQNTYAHYPFICPKPGKFSVTPWNIMGQNRLRTLCPQWNCWKSEFSQQALDRSGVNIFKGKMNSSELHWIHQPSRTLVTWAEALKSQMSVKVCLKFQSWCELTYFYSLPSLEAEKWFYMRTKWNKGKDMADNLHVFLRSQIWMQFQIHSKSQHIIMSLFNYKFIYRAPPMWDFSVCVCKRMDKIVPLSPRSL